MVEKSLEYVVGAIRLAGKPVTILSLLKSGSLLMVVPSKKSERRSNDGCNKKTDDDTKGKREIPGHPVMNQQCQRWDAEDEREPAKSLYDYARFLADQSGHTAVSSAQLTCHFDYPMREAQREVSRRKQDQANPESPKVKTIDTSENE